MTLPELCIRRPVMTTLLSAAMIIFGIFAYRLLPVAALPAVEFPTIVVTATLPGASPETMASSVATPLEKQFGTIAGVESISSQSGRGTTRITLEFSLDRNIDAAALDVQSALSVAARRLPKEMTEPPSFRKVNPADQPVILLAFTSNTLPLSTVNEFAESLVGQRLSTLPGVAQVLVYGQQKFAVRVQADLDALTSRGLALEDVAKTLSATNSNSPLGTLSSQSQTLTLESTGQVRHAEGYKPLVVAWRNGAPVRLADVAAIYDSVENDKLASWFDGRRSIVLAVQRQPDANTIAVTDAVKNLLPTFRAQVPPAIGIDILVDRSQSIRHSVDDVQFTLALSIALVVMVIFLFLRNLTATIIPAVVLPVSLIGTFAVMYVLGFSINNLTLMALTLAVGFVVDDAIVMLENIMRHVEAGMNVFQAALKGSREIAFTIVSITISLIAAFIPVLFMGGVIGRLFNEFAVTISIAILISGLVSLTLTPMMCSRLIKNDHDQEHGRLYHIIGAGWDGLLTLYRVTLDVVLQHRFITLLVTFLTLGLTIHFYGVISKGFFPVEDTGLISVITEAAEDTSFQAMSERQRMVAEIIRSDPDVQALNSTIGVGGPNATLNSGRMFVILREDRETRMPQVIQRLRRKVASVAGMSVFFQPVQNITTGARISKSLYQYTIQATDLQELYQWTPVIEGKVKSLPGLQDVTTDLQVRSPVAMIDIDREKAATLGVSVEQLRGALYNAYGSRQVATIYTPSDDFAVILEASPRYQMDSSLLSRLHVRSGGGNLIPLDAFAAVRRSVGPLSVNHQAQLPSVTISFNLVPGTALGAAVDSIRAAEKDMGLPATIVTSFQGTAQVFQKSLANQGMLIGAAIIVVYIVLGVLYESFVHPITILSGLPSAALGALLTLMVFNEELSVIAVIGIVMLIGIVKKNAIMMIDFAITRRAEGASPYDAIRDACLLRFRPIMMTTLAAMVGALPIALGLGAGAELRRPLGLAVVGGLIVSQVLTLYITPVIYMYIEGLRIRLSGKPEHAASEQGHPQPAE